MRSMPLVLLVAGGLSHAALAQNSGQVVPTSPVVDPIPDADELSGVSIDPTIRSLASRLGSDSFQDREQAMVELLDGVYPHLQLYAVLHQESLDAEQRHRLLEVVRQRLVNAPRGAVGISMSPWKGTPGEAGEVQVVDLLPGLPAERIMQIGDRIFEIDGEPLFTRNDLVERVQKKQPGDPVLLSVRRAVRDEAGRRVLDEQERPIYETLDVKLALGSAELLFNPADGRPERESPVQKRRREEAKSATTRFGPSPQPIQIRSGASGSFGPDKDQDNREISANTIDQHGAIRKLLVERRFIAQGQINLSPSLRRKWNRKLEQLVQQAQRIGLGAEERAYREQVVLRYRTLVEAVE